MRVGMAVGGTLVVGVGSIVCSWATQAMMARVCMIRMVRIFMIYSGIALLE
jgi:hypothetical protein